MSGNIWEWVEDCWHDNYAGAPSDGNALTIGSCEFRVVRGGSWGYDPNWLRSAYRLYSAPGNRLDNFGFRVARTL